MTLQTLAIRRQALLELAYRGRIDLLAWQALIAAYIAIEANFNAAWCIMKIHQLSA